MTIEIGFNPTEYVVENFPVSNDMWVELDGNERVPASTKKRFYTPSKNAKKDWPEMLKVKYGIEEYAFYDPKITGLFLEVTKEMIEEGNNNRFKCLKFVDDDGKEVQPELPRIDDAENYLISKQAGLAGRLAAENLIRVFGTKKAKEELKKKKLTNFEKKLDQWHPGYGFLYKNREVMFARSIPQEELKYEIVREYLFHIREAPDVLISLAQEPNTDRAFWGLRRSLRLDWPFDSAKNTFRQVIEGEFSSVDNYIGKMNNLLENLEYIVTK